MYHAPDNIYITKAESWKITKRYLRYCFVGFWLFNILYAVFIEGIMGLFVLFFAQWLCCVPLFIASALLNYFLMNRFFHYNDSRTTSYQKMLLWGFLNGLTVITFGWSIDKILNLSIAFGWRSNLAFMASIMSGQFAIGGLVSIKRQQVTYLERSGSIAFASIAFALMYIIRTNHWFFRTLLP